MKIFAMTAAVLLLRITSYNVCYTKLLRIDYRTGDLRLRWKHDGETRITYAMDPVDTNEVAEARKGREESIERGEIPRGGPPMLSGAARDSIMDLLLRITSYNVCYTKLLRSPRASLVSPWIGLAHSCARFFSRESMSRFDRWITITTADSRPSRCARTVGSICLVPGLV